MSVERIALLTGVPPEVLTGAAVTNLSHQVDRIFTRDEVLGESASGTPYLKPEGVAGSSALSFVVPPGSAQPWDIASGEDGILIMILKIKVALLDLPGLEFSPAEPSAGTTVEFAPPHAQNGLPGGSPIRYQWNFGDGTTSEQAAPKHAYHPGADDPPITEYEASVEVIATNQDAEEEAVGMKFVTVRVKNPNAAQAPPAATSTTPTPAPPATPGTAATPASPGTPGTAATPAPPGTTTALPPEETAVAGAPSVTRRASQPQFATGPAQGHSQAPGEGSRGPASSRGAAGGNRGNPGQPRAALAKRAPVRPAVALKAAYSPPDKGEPASVPDRPESPQARGQAAPASDRQLAPPARRPLGLVGVLLNSIAPASPASAPAGGSAAPGLALRATHPPVGPLGVLGVSCGDRGCCTRAPLGGFRRVAHDAVCAVIPQTPRPARDPAGRAAHRPPRSPTGEYMSASESQDGGI